LPFFPLVFWEQELRISGSLIGVRILEVVLGGLFLYAGLQKYLNAYEFAEAVLAYQLLPVALVGAAAAVLPWVEISAGLCLVVGLKRRSCLILLGGLVAGFLIAIFITMARGLNIDCGCGLFFQRQAGWGAVAQDLVLLVWVVGLYGWERRLPGRARPELLDVTSQTAD
jgi:putative oxidoreductase